MIRIWLPTFAKNVKSSWKVLVLSHLLHPSRAPVAKESLAIMRGVAKSWTHENNQVARKWCGYDVIANLKTVQ